MGSYQVRVVFSHEIRLWQIVSQHFSGVLFCNNIEHSLLLSLRSRRTAPWIGWLTSVDSFEHSYNGHNYLCAHWQILVSCYSRSESFAFSMASLDTGKTFSSSQCSFIGTWIWTPQICFLSHIKHSQLFESYTFGPFPTMFKQKLWNSCAIFRCCCTDKYTGGKVITLNVFNGFFGIKQLVESYQDDPQIEVCTFKCLQEREMVSSTWQNEHLSFIDIE